MKAFFILTTAILLTVVAHADKKMTYSLECDHQIENNDWVSHLKLCSEKFNEKLIVKDISFEKQEDTKNALYFSRTITNSGENFNLGFIFQTDANALFVKEQFDADNIDYINYVYINNLPHLLLKLKKPTNDNSLYFKFPYSAKYL